MLLSIGIKTIILSILLLVNFMLVFISIYNKSKAIVLDFFLLIKKIKKNITYVYPQSIIDWEPKYERTHYFSDKFISELIFFTFKFN